MKSSTYRLAQIVTATPRWVAIYETREETSQFPVALWALDVEGTLHGMVASDGGLVSALEAGEGFCGYTQNEPPRSMNVNIRGEGE